ncbi:MAG: hypothetical protein ABDH28_07795, partial [Brevinematia bacterium]
MLEVEGNYLFSPQLVGRCKFLSYMKYILFFLEYLFFLLLKVIVRALGFKRSKSFGKLLGRL